MSALLRFVLGVRLAHSLTDPRRHVGLHGEGLARVIRAHTFTDQMDHAHAGHEEHKAA